MNILLVADLVRDLFLVVKGCHLAQLADIPVRSTALSYCMLSQFHPRYERSRLGSTYTKNRRGALIMHSSYAI